MKRVKSNPGTLFLIIADEAHVAITKKENVQTKDRTEDLKRQRDTETANDAMVNQWKDDEHPNAVVLQV